MEEEEETAHLWCFEEESLSGATSRKVFPVAICAVLVLLLVADSVCFSEAADTRSSPQGLRVNFLERTVLKTNLTLNVPTSIFDNNITLSAVLTDVNGNPVQNVPVEFEVYGKVEWTNVAQTDNSGYASINYAVADTGGLQVRAIFNGTENYAASLSESRLVSVYPSSYMLYLVASAAVTVVVGVVIGVGELRDRKKIGSPQKA
jgi:hypothetical protein